MCTAFQNHFNASRRTGTLPKSLKDCDLVDRLGTGSFSEVWSIRQRGSHKSFALKTINKQQIKVQASGLHVYMERLVLQQQLGPETPHLYAIFQDSAYLYFLTELAENGTLAKYLKKQGRSLNAQQRRRLVEQIVDLMEKIHSKGIVHGDLKPENILLDAHLKPMLCDFGCARVVHKKGMNDSLFEQFAQIQDKYEEKSRDSSKSSTNASLTSEDEITDQINRYINLGSLTGTVDYLSPEVIQGKSAGFASDFWALGVIVHQIFGGKPLFRKDGCEMETVRAIEAGESCLDPTLPDDVQDFIKSLTEIDQNKRLGSRKSSHRANFEEVWSHPIFNHEFSEQKTEEISWLKDASKPDLSKSVVSQGDLGLQSVDTLATAKRWLFFSEMVRLKAEGMSLSVLREKDMVVLQTFALDSHLIIRHNAGREVVIERNGVRFECTLIRENSVDWVRRVQENLVK